MLYGGMWEDTRTQCLWDLNESFAAIRVVGLRRTIVCGFDTETAFHKFMRETSLGAAHSLWRVPHLKLQTWEGTVVCAPFKEQQPKRYEAYQINLLQCCPWSLGWACLRSAATNWPNVHPPDNICIWRAVVKLYWQGETRSKACSSSTLSTTKPAWTYPGANPSLRGERPVNSRLSHDTALLQRLSTTNSLWKSNTDNK
jgi:hypothetical protein